MSSLSPEPALDSAPRPLHAIPGEEFESRSCKVRGCTNDAVSLRGIYGLLCHKHAAEKRALLREPSGAGEYEQKAKALVPLAKALDRARKRYLPAREEFRSAMEAWARAIEELAS